MALRSVSPGSWGQEVSSHWEERSRSRGHTPSDGAVSDLPSGAGLGTASWLLATSLRDLKPRARSRLDKGRDDHVDWNPVNQPPLDQLHPLDRLSVRITVWSPVVKM